MSVLSNIEPKEVLYWFEEISKIPRGSGNMEGISNFCEKFAKERNLFCIKDEHGNVIITKEATSGYENREAVILQGHLDMVCEKKEDCDIDFLKDPLRLKVEGDYIYAEGTTLGADDGVAIAYILAILNSDDISHPPIEAVLTVDEEIGLLGAGSVDLSMLKSKRLINLDIEEEGVFTVSCAGGATVTCTLPVNFKNTCGNVYTITLSGLKGGHSGAEIDKNRGNSNVLMARLLNKLNINSDILVSEIKGGLKDNAIPVKTTAKIVTKDNLDEIIINYNKILKNEYQTSDADVFVSFEKTKDKIMAADRESTDKIIFLLNSLPDGIQKMSADIEGLVETSLNMGKLLTEKDSVVMSFAVRSSVETEKEALIEKIKTITEFAGGKIDVSGVYSGWEYNKDSSLRKIMVNEYKKMYNKEPVIEAIHAGLECGMFTQKIKGLDCISIGPDIFDIHTPMERASISSLKRTWEFLKAVLKNV